MNECAENETLSKFWIGISWMRKQIELNDYFIESELGDVYECVQIYPGCRCEFSRIHVNMNQHSSYWHSPEEHVIWRDTKHHRGKLIFKILYSSVFHIFIYLFCLIDRYLPPLSPLHSPSFSFAFNYFHFVRCCWFQCNVYEFT